MREYIRPDKNCPATMILNIVYYCGEIPLRALRVYGKSDVYMRAVAGRLVRDGYLIKARSIGKPVFKLGKNRTEDTNLFPLAEETYSTASKETYDGDKARAYRAFCRAETCVLVKQAGFSLYPMEKPDLKKKKIEADTKAFYTTQEIKQLMDIKNTWTYASRSIGVIVRGYHFYTVYFITEKTTKISEFTESTSIIHFETELNGSIEAPVRLEYIKINTCTIFAHDYGKTLISLLTGVRYRYKYRHNQGDSGETIENGRYFFTVDDLYEEYILIPYKKEGAEFLEIFTTTGYEEKLLHLSLPEEAILKTPIHFACDGIVDGAYVMVFLDGKLKKLRKFLRYAQAKPDELFKIYCYDFQAKALEKYVGTNIELVIFDQRTVLDAMHEALRP